MPTRVTFRRPVVSSRKISKRSKSRSKSRSSRSASRSQSRSSRSASRSKSRSSRSTKRSKSRTTIRLLPTGPVSKVRIPIKKGGLKRYMSEEQQKKGYTNLTVSERRSVLHKAMQHESPLTLFRRLNAMVIVRKNKTDPKDIRIRQKFLDDRNWVRKFL